MASSYYPMCTLTQGAKRSARGCSGTCRGCNCTRCTRLATGLNASHLAPDQHGAEDDLEAVEEVVADDDDRGAARGPALARTDGFYTRRGRRRQET